MGGYMQAGIPLTAYTEAYYTYSITRQYLGRLFHGKFVSLTVHFKTLRLINFVHKYVHMRAYLSSAATYLLIVNIKFTCLTAETITISM